MNWDIAGLWIGFLGGMFRAIIGFVYRKAKNPNLKFKPWKFIFTLIECSIAGLLLGLSTPITSVKAGIALALAAAGVSELLGKTGFHDLIGLKK